MIYKCNKCGATTEVFKNALTRVRYDCPCGGIRTSLIDDKEPVAEVPCSAGVSYPAVDEDMLIRAMKKAVEVGIFPKTVDLETYEKHWGGMEEVLQAAVGN